VFVKNNKSALCSYIIYNRLQNLTDEEMNLILKSWILF